MKHKNIILYAGKIPELTVENVQKLGQKTRRKHRVALIYDSKKKNPFPIPEGVDIVLSCDLDSDEAITKTLLPYFEEIIAVVVRGDSVVPQLQKIIPHLPYVKTSTVQSLKWATDKIAMRQMFSYYDKTITPPFTVVHNAKKVTLKKIEEDVGFPVVVKPAGLAASLLVSVCFHEEELEKVLKTTFRKIRTIYKEANGRGEPSVLVEQFMEGEMYSVDAYIGSKGNISFCPLVHVKTGRSIGFDDFFGYQRITPTTLNKEDIEEAEEVATRSVYSLRLRSTSAHIELLKTNQGWKVIEVGPRLGGFRHVMYIKSFGINHSANDVLIRTSEKPIIPKKVLGHTAVFQFFAKDEGVLTKLTGIKKAQELRSFFSIEVNKKLGDRCLYAKNGGKSVFDIILFNKDRSELLADIRRLEQMVEIETETRSSGNNTKKTSSKPKKVATKIAQK
ncbi:MAG: ATP-grasp domain-containing protein [Candidatus Pacebacteria bacterium]|nr:ATP-grasp domain-containing protein [Candidatus Paceibacterota bacterium]